MHYCWWVDRMRRKETTNQHAEEKRWVFSFYLKEEWRQKTPDRERKRFPDHRSVVLEGSLLQSHWWTWWYIICTSFIAQFCLSHCCPWISVCGFVFLAGLWCLNVVVLLVRLGVLHRFMLQWIVTCVYGCCVCLSWYKDFNSEESGELFVLFMLKGQFFVQFKAHCTDFPQAQFLVSLGKSEKIHFLQS